MSRPPDSPGEGRLTSLTFVYFGTPDFSTLVLNELATTGYTPAAVITTPDKPAGRGLLPMQSPVKKWALEREIPVLQPETFDERAISALSSVGADYAIVAAYGKIIPQRILDLFSNEALNVHPSLLPRYRGTSPVESQILADEEHIGISVIQMDAQMDHGPLVAQEEISIPNWPVNRNAANDYLWKAGGKLLARTLPAWLDGSMTLTPQDETQATFTKKITKENGALDLSAPARANYLKYLAYDGWPGTYFFENRKRMKITSAEFAGGEFRVLRVIPEGKSEMDYRA